MGQGVVVTRKTGSLSDSKYGCANLSNKQKRPLSMLLEITKQYMAPSGKKLTFGSVQSPRLCHFAIAPSILVCTSQQRKCFHRLSNLPLFLSRHTNIGPALQTGHHKLKISNQVKVELQALFFAKTFTLPKNYVTKHRCCRKAISFMATTDTSGQVDEQQGSAAGGNETRNRCLHSLASSTTKCSIRSPPGFS